MLSDLISIGAHATVDGVYIEIECSEFFTATGRQIRAVHVPADAGDDQFVDLNGVVRAGQGRAVDATGWSNVECAAISTIQDVKRRGIVFCFQESLMVLRPV